MARCAYLVSLSVMVFGGQREDVWEFDEAKCD